MERLSRRSFMKVAGAATGAAALAAAPPLAKAAVGDGAERIDPTTGVAEEPLVAYVRNVERGEITVTAGTDQHTYRDRALVQRLLRAAGKRGVS
jgi:TAT (twin-arginine translocation) pathway signal sequence